MRHSSLKKKCLPELNTEVSVNKDAAEVNRPTSVERLMTRYEDIVYQLAMDLTNCTEKSHKVVETVFLQLNREIRESEVPEIHDIKTRVHRLTYDSALELMFAPLSQVH